MPGAKGLRLFRRRSTQNRGVRCEAIRNPVLQDDTDCAEMGRKLWGHAVEK